MTVERLAGPVVTHRRPRVGVRAASGTPRRGTPASGEIHLPIPAAFARPFSTPGGSAPVQALTGGADKDGAVFAVADCEVDRCGRPRRK